ncbi:MAG TPA: SDR family oxidoreductase [Haliangium sp.]|nr:SDR family oxidoreductase [Haliangium sp.]
MQARSFVITGASTGIGRSAALHLDRLGHRVFAGVRKASDGDALRASASARLTPVTLDVGHADQIEAAARAVEEALMGAPLDGLVNNAGIALGGPLEFMDVARLRHQLEVNVVGLVATTQALLPLVRRGPGRIVHIGSMGGRVAFPFMGPYCASKFAVEAVTDALRMELGPWGIQVSVVEPSPVQSAIWDKAQDQYRELMAALPARAHELYGPYFEGVMSGVADSVRRAVPTTATDRAIEHALLAPRPRTRYVVGTAARMVVAMRWLLPDRLLDRALTSR